MIYLRRRIEQATEAKARADWWRGYSDGVQGLNPPNPEDLSSDYQEGYADGCKAARRGE